MNISRLFRPAAIAAVALLAGCSAHYRAAMNDYKKAEPASFVQRTLDWTAGASADDRTSAPLTIASPRLSDLATTSPQQALLRVAAVVLNRDAATLEPLLAAHRDPPASDRRLQGNLQWDELALAVAARNPSVAAAAADWRAMLDQFNQADYLETLVGQFRAFTRNLDVETGSQNNKGMTRAFLPYPATMALKGEMVRHEARLAELAWQAALRDALLDAGERFYTIRYLDQAAATAQDSIKIVADLAKVTEDRYRAGNSDQADMLGAQTELARLRNQLADLEAQRRSECAKLNALLDRPADAPLGKPGADRRDRQSSADTLTARALAGRQEANEQAEKVERARTAIRMGEAMNRPLAGAGYARLERGMMPEASAGVAMPGFGEQIKTTVQPDFAQTEAYLGEMRRRLEANEAMLRQMQAESRAMARMTFDDLDMARRMAALIETVVLPQAKTVYDTAQSRYQSGSAGYADLKEAQRAWIDARLEGDATRRDLNLALLRTAKTTGSFDPE